MDTPTQAANAPRHATDQPRPLLRRSEADPRIRLAVRAGAAVAAAAAGAGGLIDSATGGADVDLSLGATASGVLATGRFLTAAVSIALMSLMPSLWRGKRWAAVASVVLTGALLLLGAPGSRPFLVPAAAALLTLVGLGWGAFATRSDPFGVKSVGLRFLMAEAAILVYGIVGLNLLDLQFLGTTDLIGSITDGLRLLFLAPAVATAPATVHGAHFIESVRLLSLVNIASTVLILIVPLIRRPVGADHDLATKIVAAHGSNRLAHFALWGDKTFSIAPQHDGLVSYHVKGRVALALGGPIGSPTGRTSAIETFLADADTHGWIPAFHQVSDDDRPLLESAGFRLQQVGAEAIVDVQNFTLDGSHWKKVRSSMSMLKRDGLAVEELQHPIDTETIRELEAVSDAWLSAGGHRERTFTLGQFSAAYVQSTRVFVIRDSTHRIDAFVNVVPPYQSTVGTFDLMRRRPDSMNGVMDALFIAMIETFKAEGMTGMNLGMAPLAQLGDEAPLDRGLQQLRAHGEQWFNFEGLEKFKEKWQPEWENRYVAYRNAAELPAVLRAVQTIGEIDSRDGTRLQRLKPIIRRFPATISLGGFILWLMAATAIDPTFHQEIIDGFGLSWPDLFDLDLWRIFAAALVQTEPGFVGSNALMALTVLPAVEWLVGTRRTLLTYWLGNLITTIPVLFALRLLGEIGDLDALHFAYSRDAGSSTGLWALAGTLVSRLPNRRWQYGVLGAVLTLHAGLALGTREVANTQHLVATIVGFALGFVIIEGSVRARVAARFRQLIPGERTPAGASAN